MEDGLILNNQIARKNWGDWRSVFEHGISIHTNPLLASQDLFRSFCNGYSVSRTIRQGAQNEFRIELGEPPFSAAMGDDTGRALDILENDLRPRFGTHDGRNRIISVLSKVAAFVRPERFVAWDRYAKRGVNVVLHRPPSFRFNAYADYLADFDKVWIGPIGQQIRDYAMRNGALHTVETEPRFLRRVLDVHLMKCGGRTTWGREGALVQKG